MRTIECRQCHATPQHVALYRVNAKGQPGEWACDEHGGVPIPLVELIESHAGLADSIMQQRPRKPE